MTTGADVGGELGRNGLPPLPLAPRRRFILTLILVFTARTATGSIGGRGMVGFGWSSPAGGHGKVLLVAMGGRRRLARAAKEKEGESDLDNVSDDEALLACHAYLTRKGRVPWKAREARRRQQHKQQKQRKWRQENRSESQDAIGYFWNDPRELVFLPQREGESFLDAAADPDSNIDALHNHLQEWIDSADETEDEQEDDDEDDVLEYAFEMTSDDGMVLSTTSNEEEWDVETDPDFVSQRQRRHEYVTEMLGIDLPLRQEGDDKVVETKSQHEDEEETSARENKSGRSKRARTVAGRLESGKTYEFQNGHFVLVDDDNDDNDEKEEEEAASLDGTATEGEVFDDKDNDSGQEGGIYQDDVFGDGPQLGEAVEMRLFTFPKKPLHSHLERSKASKRTWQDAKFRQRWYEKRWGNYDDDDKDDDDDKPRRWVSQLDGAYYGSGYYFLDEDELDETEEEDEDDEDETPAKPWPVLSSERAAHTRQRQRERTLQRRVAGLPPSVWQSDEFKSLSNDEIEDAIRTYVQANKRKAQAHRKNNMNKKQENDDDDDDDGKANPQEDKDNTVIRSKQVEPTTADKDAEQLVKLKELQKKRSERATKAYQTRLANLQKAQTKTTTTTITTKATQEEEEDEDEDDDDDWPKTSHWSAAEAMARIEEALRRQCSPSPQDVRFMMQPVRLGKRKQLLRRILSERFQLRGRCIPPSWDSGPRVDKEECLFASQCKVEVLARFVIQKLEQEARPREI